MDDSDQTLHRSETTEDRRQRFLGEILDPPFVWSPVPITTSWRAPLEPSMMVTVLCWPGAACLGAAPVSSLDEAVVVALSSPANLDSGIMLVTGSLWRKCLLKPATPTKATRKQAEQEG
jgi:hypothetical protein